MKPGTIEAMSLTGTVVLFTGFATGSFGWMFASLAFDEYEGQQRAFDISISVFIVWALITTLIAFAFGLLITYLLSNRRKYNAFVSAIFSTIVSVALTVFLHTAGLFVSTGVASWYRTT